MIVLKFATAAVAQLRTGSLQLVRCDMLQAHSLAAGPDYVPHNILRDAFPPHLSRTGECVRGQCPEFYPALHAATGRQVCVRRRGDTASCIALPPHSGATAREKKSPEPARPDRGCGWFAGSSLVSRRREILAISQVVDVAEHRWSRRQVLRLGEQRVKNIVPGWRLIDDVVAAFERARVVSRVVQAD